MNERREPDDFLPIEGGGTTLYRKRPIPVAASQWHKHGDHDAVEPLPGTQLCQLLAEDRDRFGWCPTLEGGHIVSPGDWIITGVRGEHYPCKPDIFAETYERVE